MLFPDMRPAGDYSLKFYGVELLSGIYFYTLETKEFLQINKMIILK